MGIWNDLKNDILPGAPEGYKPLKREPKTPGVELPEARTVEFYDDKHDKIVKATVVLDGKHEASEEFENAVAFIAQFDDQFYSFLSNLVKNYGNPADEPREVVEAFVTHQGDIYFTPEELAEALRERIVTKPQLLPIDPETGKPLLETPTMRELQIYHEKQAQAEAEAAEAAATAEEETTDTEPSATDEDVTSSEDSEN